MKVPSVPDICQGNGKLHLPDEASLRHGEHMETTFETYAREESDAIISGEKLVAVGRRRVVVWVPSTGQQGSRCVHQAEPVRALWGAPGRQFGVNRPGPPPVHAGSLTEPKHGNQYREMRKQGEFAVIVGTDYCLALQERDNVSA